MHYRHCAARPRHPRATAATTARFRCGTATFGHSLLRSGCPNHKHDFCNALLSICIPGTKADGTPGPTWSPPAGTATLGAMRGQTHLTLAATANSCSADWRAEDGWWVCWGGRAAQPSTSAAAQRARPNPWLERTATGYAAWPFRGQQVNCPLQGQAAPPVAARSAQTLGLALSARVLATHV
jgi:hypothetical protein